LHAKLALVESSGDLIASLAIVELGVTLAH